MRRRALLTRAFTLLATIAVALAVSPGSGQAWTRPAAPGLKLQPHLS
jgi:predicted nucleic acid-binding Zn ribbon protein